MKNVVVMVSEGKVVVVVEAVVVAVVFLRLAPIGALLFITILL